MKKIGKLLMGLCLMLALIGVVEGPAFADSCKQWDPTGLQCMVWFPDLFPNSSWACGNPGAHQISFYVSTNYVNSAPNAYCQTINVPTGGVYINDTGTAGNPYDMYQFYSIRSIWMGSGVGAFYY